VISRPAADGSGPPEHARVVGWVDGGAWAERAAVRTAHLARLPDEISYEVASTLPVAGITAVAATRLGGDVSGRRVAITGANGGLGRFAVQVAKTAGAHVTAVVTAPDRAAGLSELGADEIEIGLDADGAPLDLVVESIGGPTLAAALARVSAEGTVVTLGNSSNSTTEFDPRTFYRRGAPTLRGLFVVWELLQERLGSPELAFLLEMVSRGDLRADIELVTSWQDAASAVDALLDRRVAGKVVLRVR
jgi:NADPH:quinone reductase-like Zn-dependent oxidoreductase